MSILDNNPSELNSPAKIAADQLIRQAKSTFKNLVQVFNQGSSIFWNNSMGASPQDIANELGSNAKEIFELHYKLGQLIASVKPEAVIHGNNLVGNFTINDDGTVTVIPIVTTTTTEQPEQPE